MGNGRAAANTNLLGAECVDSKDDRWPMHFGEGEVSFAAAIVQCLRKVGMGFLVRQQPNIDAAQQSGKGTSA